MANISSISSRLSILRAGGEGRDIILSIHIDLYLLNPKVI
jgi:hypothetical protein